MTSEEQKEHDKKIQEAKQFLIDDQIRREEDFNKELAELKKKWGVQQHPTIGNEIVQEVIKVLTSVPINITAKAK